MEKIGVYLHSGGFGHDTIGDMFRDLPLCAIWYESEEPTAQKLASLKEIPEKLSEGWSREYLNGFLAEGANTVTLKKENGLWTYRRLTWEYGPTWYAKPTSLNEIKKEVLRS